jgi:predicted nucleotidyltransferase
MTGFHKSIRRTRRAPADFFVGFKENSMNVFEEFKRLVTEFENQKVRYALVGGVAMAFYTEPRFTRDIDLLVDSDDFDKAKGILEKDGYFESALPWTFRNVAIEIHRFLKVLTADDEMLIDLLVAKDEEVRRIIRNAVEAESEEGRVMLANKKDLIRLKRTRNSKQDQADIEKLEDDKIR